MAITEETTTVYKCSDGSTHLNKLDAEIHETDLALRAACDDHGYSGPSFSRDFLYDFLVEYGHHFAGLAEVLRAMTLAYQAAAFDTHIGYVKAHPADRAARELAKRYRYLLRRSKSLWDLACLVAGNADASPMVFPLLRDDPHLRAEYMARLTNKKPINAPTET